MKLFHIYPLIVVTLLSSAKTSGVSSNESDESRLERGIQVEVPWKEDTTYVDCVSEIPRIVDPTASSSCRLMNKPTRRISTHFGACFHDRIITRTWFFSDVCGNNASVSQVIVVKDDIPPEVVVPWGEDTLWLACASDIPPIIYPTVTDNCEMKDTTRSIETRFGACPNERTIKRTWIFRDMCDNETRAIQVIVVKDDIPPEVVVPWGEDTLWLECASDIPPIIYPTVTDNCEMKDTTRSIETRFGACTNERTIKRTWIFRDVCDNETRATQVIVVKDDIPPEVVVPWGEDTLWLECASDIPPIIYPAVTDNCEMKDTTRSIETRFGACTNERTIKRTWIFRDVCDNETRATQVIVVKDDIPPEVVVPWGEDTLWLECASDIPPIIYPTVTDNCEMKDTTRSIETRFGACPNERTIKRTWLFRDVCDNETRATQVIVVKDDIPPEVVVPWFEDTLWLECASDIPPIVYPAVTDNCEMKDTTRSIETRFGACTNERTIKRTWLFRDVCDNETRATQVIVVKDDIPPTITNCPTKDFLRTTGTRASFYRTSGHEFDIKSYDNCTGDVEYSFALTGASRQVGIHTLDKVAFMPGETKVKWSAMDACGNVATCEFKVKVQFPVPIIEHVEIPYQGLQVYPNPFSEFLMFEFGSPVDAIGTIDIYDLTGKRVKRIFHGPVKSGKDYQVTFIPTIEIEGIYFYHMKLGEDIIRGKVFYNK